MNRFLDGLKLVVAFLGYYAYVIGSKPSAKSISWIVGVEEIASVVKNLANAIPHSYSFVEGHHQFYDHQYDEVPRRRGGSIYSTIENVLLRPLAFARLVHRARGFIYVGSKGFLGLAGGSRAAEFKFIKKRNRGLVIYFTGSDIRSLKLLRDLEARNGVPNISTALAEAGGDFWSPEYDDVRKRTAAEADAWADAIFTARVDQLSYLTRPTEPFLYFIPEDQFSNNTEKFDLISHPTVLHAPSSHAVKGTRLVREAVDALRSEGYEFDYIELSRVPHAEVRAVLARAHIVLNQFYALMPGVFGVESLASRCAVLMSADSEVEQDLPDNSNSAWMVTRHDQIVENLRTLLDDPVRMVQLANAGYEWARAHASESSAAARLNAVLDGVLDGSYASELRRESG